jgi:hypothetical protein
MAVAVADTGSGWRPVAIALCLGLVLATSAVFARTYVQPTRCWLQLNLDLEQPSTTPPAVDWRRA